MICIGYDLIHLINEMKLIIEQAKKDKIEQKSKKDINLNKNIKK